MLDRVDSTICHIDCDFHHEHAPQEIMKLGSILIMPTFAYIYVMMKQFIKMHGNEYAI